MKEIKKDADAKQGELLAEAQEKSAVIIEEGRKQLLAERQKMLSEAKVELADMIVTATERVLEDMPMKAIDRALVDKALNSH